MIRRTKKEPVRALFLGRHEANRPKRNSEQGRKRRNRASDPHPAANILSQKTQPKKHAESGRNAEKSQKSAKKEQKSVDIAQKVRYYRDNKTRKDYKMKYTILEYTAEATDLDKAFKKLDSADGNTFLEFDNKEEAIKAFEEIKCETYDFRDHGMRFFHVEAYELIEEDEDDNIDALDYKKSI